MRVFLSPGRVRAWLSLAALALVAVTLGRAAPAQAAPAGSAAAQSGGSFDVELQVYPAQADDALCPGEVYYVSVTPVGTLTRADGSTYEGAISGVRLTAASSNPRVVSVKPLSPTSQEDFIFAAHTKFEIRSLREGTATLTFRMTPAKRFVTRATLESPRVIQTARNVSARAQTMTLEVRDCIIRLQIDQVGYWAYPNITGYTEGHIEDLILRPDGRGSYRAEARFPMKTLTTYGDDITCTMNSPSLEAPLILEGELLSRRFLLLTMQFRPAIGSVHTTCTAIAPGGSATGEMFSANLWSHQPTVPLGDWYHRPNFESTPGLIDSMYIYAELEWAD